MVSLAATRGWYSDHASILERFFALQPLFGLLMVQLFSMILDFLDALAGAIAIACWWCTWVQPAKQPTRPGSSKRAEIDHFVCEAQTRVATATMPRPSNQRTATLRRRPEPALPKKQ